MTCKKLTRDSGSEGEIAKHLKEFDEGEKALLKVDSSVQKGMPHPRFHGQTVEVVREQGDSYVVELDDCGKEKRFVVRPAHMQHVEE